MNVAELRFTTVVNLGFGKALGSKDGVEIGKYKVGIPDEIMGDILYVEKAYATTLMAIARAGINCGALIDRADNAIINYVYDLCQLVDGGGTTSAINSLDGPNVLDELASLFPNIDFGLDDDEFDQMTDDDLREWADKEAKANEKTGDYLSLRQIEINREAENMVERAFEELKSVESPHQVPDGDNSRLERLLENIVGGSESVEEGLTVLVTVGFASGIANEDPWQFLSKFGKETPRFTLLVNEYLPYMNTAGFMITNSTYHAIQSSGISQEKIMGAAIIGAVQLGRWMHEHVDEMKTRYHFPDKSRQLVQEMSEILADALENLLHA